VADPVGAIVAGAAILAIYAFVYRVLFRVTVGRRRSRERRKAVALYVVIGIVVLPFVFGAALLVLVASPFQYLSFVFSSGVAAAVVFILVVAGGLITVSFRSVARSTEDVAGTGSLLTLFWLGLAFLVLFHVLWVVYMVVLGSIWPLRTVVPK
jgi:hypothetical protein